MIRSLLQILFFVPATGAGTLMGASAMAAIARPALARISYPKDHYPELALPGGQHVTVRSLLNITKPMHFGDFVWNEDSIPEGPMLVRVDLSHQMISVFRGGQEIGSAVILYGSDGTPTPDGRFPILMKDAHYFSHTYQVPMPYTLLLTKDGVAVHGSSVREGWATHGCVGVPLDFARLLFKSVKKGDPVFVLPPR
jgi:hypothetical protein